MNPDFSPELRRELLDDFYAECDELLVAVRAGLVQLGAGARDPRLEASTVEALFRHTHTLKGISALAGLRPAEQLAHGMEDLLRALTKRQTPVSEATVDLLLAGAQTLERLVTAHRLGKPLPDTDLMRADLAQALPPAGAEPDAEASAAAAETMAPVDPIADARDRGLLIYVADFTPSAALDQRGVNVAAVRQRLGQIGDILRAAPIIQGQGSLRFEFTLGVPTRLADLPVWETDEIRLRLLSENRPTPSPTKGADPSTDGSFPEALSLAPSHLIRVDLSRLDELMRITGEMVIQKSRLEERLSRVSDGDNGLKEVNLALGRSLREMREAITRVRLVPIAEIFTRMPFVVRDLVRGSEKRARVESEGNQTEVDKFLVERLKEPLLHLVRNAFVHGVETPEKRAAAGKPAEAVITLNARSSGETVLIQVRDDGAGVDGPAVAARAAKMGLPVPESLDASALLKILCAPGFSTRDQADLAAGRGVGMAVVASTVRELGGILTFETWPGRGTQFTLKLPLTLSIADAIILHIGGQSCAIPQSAVDEIIQVESAALRKIQASELAVYRGGLLPLVRLREMFRQARVDPGTLTILVVSTERGATGLVVDRVIAQREIVIRPLTDPLLQVRGIAGATELGDGRPLLILDPNAITEGVIRPNSDASVSPLMSVAASHR